MKGALVWMLLGLLARVVLAGSLELGNDEAYYALYAAHPDWSYFDHPGMVGWLTKAFEGGSDWGMRMVPLICGTLNGFLLFALGKAHGGIRVGTAAVALYMVSFYGSVISGVFLMPDAPQSTFWLAALLIAARNLTGQNRPTFLTWTGLGMSLAGALLSKYHSAFLVLGIGAYCAMHRRELLVSFGFWWMNALAFCGLLPTIWWNHLNDWISFSFHGKRVNPNQGVRLDFLAQELAGECAYQNPVVWFLTWAGVFFALRRAGDFWRTQPIALALWIALPLLATFIGFSLFRHTLEGRHVGLVRLVAGWRFVGPIRRC